MQIFSEARKETSHFEDQRASQHECCLHMSLTPKKPSVQMVGLLNTVRVLSFHLNSEPALNLDEHGQVSSIALAPLRLDFASVQEL